jgi:hypothetical protein
MWIRLLRDCQRKPPGELFPREYKAGAVIEVPDALGARTIGRGYAVRFEEPVRIPDHDYD